MTTSYPILMSRDVSTATSFYQNALGFQTTYESDWYVGLRLGAFELGILAHDHATIPEGYRSPVRGVVLNLEVDDVHAVHARLTGELGVETAVPLRDEFGRRHFIVADPDGVLLDVTQPIPPSAAYTK